MAHPPSAQSNEQNDLLRLYLEKRADLVRFFTARTGSPLEAEDLVQELYFRVSQGSSEELRNGSAYLYRLGMNLMIDRHRSTRRRKARDETYHKEHRVLVGHEAAADLPSIEDSIDARARLAKLMGAVEALPARCQQVFRMHKLDGLSHGEVAAALGISRSAVEKHMSLAMRKLGEVS